MASTSQPQSPDLSSLRSNLRRVDLVNKTPPTGRLHIETDGSVNHLVESPPSPSLDRSKESSASARSSPTVNMNINHQPTSVSPASSPQKPNHPQQTAGILPRKPLSIRSVPSTIVSNHTRVTSTPSSPRQGTTAGTSITASARTSLLVVVTDAAPQNLQTTIQSIIYYHPIQEIQLCTTSDEITKRLKMDCYTVIGKLSKDVAVQTLPSCEPNNIEKLIDILQAQGNAPLYGVLLCPPSNSAGDSSSTQLLDLDLNQMQRRWQHGTLLIQAVARYSLPLLGHAHSTPRLPISGPGSPTTASRPFFFLHTDRSESPLDSFHNSARDLLLQSLATSPLASGFLVGHTDELLKLMPAPAPRTPPRPVQTSQQYVPEPEEKSLESPTKLYYLWSMQEQT